MRYTLKDFYHIEGMYYINSEFVTEEEALNIIDKLNSDLEWDDSQAQQDAAMEDYSFGI